MGMAIMAITICHINQFIGIHKGLYSGLANEFLYASAAVGVDIFFFFSLVGLGFSIERNRITTFYIHRIKRIFPAYILFLILVLIAFYRDVCLNERMAVFAQQVFGISATKFVSQRIEWYVPSLLILYVIYPLMFPAVKWIHNHKQNKVIELLTLCATVVMSYMIGRYFVGLFAMRLPLYYLAILSYFYIRDGKSSQLDVLYILAGFCSFVVKNELLSYALIIPLFLFVMNRIIDSWRECKWCKTFSWLGHYTLEIYLAQVIATKYLIKVLPTNNIIIIIIAVLLTTSTFAFILNWFHSFIIGLVEYLKCEINQSQYSNRLTWADAAKGFAMLIIMWGHVQHPSPLKMWLTSFHVPLFLVLSGILMSRKNMAPGGGKNLINKLLYPYLTFSIIAITCHFLYRAVFSGMTVGIESIVTNVYKTITGYGIYAIWFIPSYFIACYMFSITFNISKKGQTCLLLLWVFIGMAGSELFVWLKQLIRNQYYFDAVYYPIAALFRGLACTFYIVLGRLILEAYRKIKDVCYFRYYLLLLLLSSLIFSIILSQNLYGTNFSLLKLGERPYMNFVCGTVGSLWVVVLFYLSKKIYTFPLMQWVGRKSLIIMGTHMSLLLTIFIPQIISIIVSVPDDATTGYYLFGFACVLMMLLVEIPIIKLFDGPLKSLVSKRKTN